MRFSQLRSGARSVEKFRRPSVVGVPFPRCVVVDYSLAGNAVLLVGGRGVIGGRRFRITVPMRDCGTGLC